MSKSGKKLATNTHGRLRPLHGGLQINVGVKIQVPCLGEYPEVTLRNQTFTLLGPS